MSAVTRLGPGGYPVAAKPASGPVTHDQSVAAGCSASVTLERQAGRRITVSASGAMALAKQTNRTLAASASSAVSAIKAVARSIAAAVSAAVTARTGGAQQYTQTVSVSATIAVSVLAAPPPVIGDVSVVWSAEASAEAEWATTGGVSATMTVTPTGGVS